MGIFEGILFLTDLDNTLTLSGGKAVSEENLSAIRYFQSEGGLFSIATGRSPDFVKFFENMIKPNAPVVTVNGTLICSNDGKTKLKEYIIGDEILPVIRFMLERDYMEDVYLGNLSGQYNKMTDGSVDEKMAYYSSLPKPWYKIVSRQQAEYSVRLMSELNKRFGSEFEYDRSYSMGVEVHKKGSGKGVCMDWIKEHSGLNIKETIAVGDYDNDADMIRRATYGYAVQNAIDEVKAVAKYVTVSSEESAIAHIISDIEAICRRRN